MARPDVHREEARRDRIHGAEGVIPTPLWLVLFFISAVIFVYMLFFADSAEGAVTQAMLMGSVMAVIARCCCCSASWTTPSIGRRRPQPVAMERSLRIDRPGARRRRQRRAVPCDAEGAAGERERAATGAADAARGPRADAARVAAVATAWSGYQASRWNGEQAKAFSRANGARIESTRADPRERPDPDRRGHLHPVGRRLRAATRPELADFYRRRFRAEFKPAVNAWIATRPLTNPGAPLTPFAMPQYRLAARDEAERLEAAPRPVGEGAARTSSAPPTTSSGSCCSPPALFFAGISTKLRSPRAARALLARRAGLLATVVWIATSPVSVSV